MTSHHDLPPRTGLTDADPGFGGPAMAEQARATLDRHFPSPLTPPDLVGHVYDILDARNQNPVLTDDSKPRALDAATALLAALGVRARRRLGAEEPGEDPALTSLRRIRFWDRIASSNCWTRPPQTTAAPAS